MLKKSVTACVVCEVDVCKNAVSGEADMKSASRGQGMQMADENMRWASYGVGQKMQKNEAGKCKPAPVRNGHACIMAAHLEPDLSTRVVA